MLQTVETSDTADWPRLRREARALASELRPGLELPRQGWPRHQRKARAYATTLRNYAINRRLESRGREELRPLYFIWTLLRSCNFSCSYCDDHRGRKYPDLPNDGILDTQQAKRLLQVMRTGTPSVYFAGGEPTLRDDLPEITRAARDLSYFPILINTNGSTLHQRLTVPSWRTFLADIDIVIVSLDALNPRRLGRLWGTRRPDHVLRNLLLLRELRAEMGFKLMVNTVIQPGRISDARAVLDLAAELDVWFCPVPRNVGPTIDKSLLLEPEYRDFAELILERKRAGQRISGSLRMNRRLLFAESLDCRNTLKPHVDFDGKLIWPCKASVNVPPVSIDVLQFEDVESLYAHAVTRVDPTRFHGPACNQCGADCNWAQNYSTDAYVHGLRHPASLLGDVRELLRS